VLECSNEEAEKQIKGQVTSMQSHVVLILYSIFMAISIFFIILTILAYYFTPELKSLHGKCIIFQSGTLAVAYVGFIIIHQTGSFSHIAVCKISGCITLALYNFNQMKMVSFAFYSLCSVCILIVLIFLDQLHVL
jgi:hypothetical protein